VTNSRPSRHWSFGDEMMGIICILNFTSSWDFVIFREYLISTSRCNIGAVYARKGHTKKRKRHGLHGFALDQPSTYGIGLELVQFIVQKK